jgi:hypothetical protein
LRSKPSWEAGEEPRVISVEKLFSGEPKYVNVHKAGGSNPPILSCANLRRAGSPTAE